MEQSQLSLEDDLERLLSEDISSITEREKFSFNKTIELFNNTLVIFGAGSLGRKILAQLRKEGIEPIAFADNNPNTWGKFIDGIKVFSPKEAAENFGAKATFLVTIWNPGSHHQFKETKRTLISLNCQNVSSFVPFMWKYPEIFLPNCFLDLPHKIAEAKTEVKKAFSLLEDVESQATYISQIKWRMLENFDTLRSRTSEIQYFPNFINLSNDEIFIDCGAYDGDTIRDFLSVTENSFKVIHAFEPDSFNFTNLTNYVKSLPAKEKIHLYQNAVGIRSEILRFQSTGTASSLLSASGGNEVQSISLDEVLKGKFPSFIKMDIEGAEIDALLGARSLITKFTPILAICVYHKQDHLWKIPLLIASLSKNYRFFLRAHKEEGWDLVFYAIPTDRLKV